MTCAHSSDGSCKVHVRLQHKDLILVLNDFAVIRSVDKLKNLCL